MFKWCQDLVNIVFGGTFHLSITPKCTQTLLEVTRRDSFKITQKYYLLDQLLCCALAAQPYNHRGVAASDFVQIMHARLMQRRVDLDTDRRSCANLSGLERHVPAIAIAIKVRDWCDALPRYRKIVKTRSIAGSASFQKHKQLANSIQTSQDTSPGPEIRISTNPDFNLWRNCKQEEGG